MRSSLRAIMLITGAFQTNGGIAAVNRLVFYTLSAAGYNVEYYSLLEEDSSALVDLSGKVYIRKGVYHNRKVAFTGGVMLALAQRNFDLVFCDHVNLASILSPWFILGFYRPLVWLHGVEVFPPRPDFEGRLGLAQAWRCLASSEFTRQTVLARYPNKQIAVCEPALDPLRNPLMSIDELSQPLEPLELTCLAGEKRRLGDRVILCVGRMSSLERYKGQDTLIRAFPNVQAVFPDAQLLLVGDGDDAPRLGALANGLDLPQRQAIFMPGRVEQDLLRNLYRCCALFAMPSTGEGFGIVYLEAMSFARPCIGSALDAAQCLIQDGRTGIVLQNAQDPAALADAVIRLFLSPELLRQMGLASYELVKSRYTFRQFQERFWSGLQN